jgi:hypothetical protein
MPKRISNAKSHKDVNQYVGVVQESTMEPESPIDRSMLSKIMSAMGKKGGKIGGKRRLVTMTPEERSQIALKAANARWGKKPPKRR